MSDHTSLIPLTAEQHQAAHAEMAASAQRLVRLGIWLMVITALNMALTLLNWWLR